jgi:hypothetical protein
MAMFDAEWYLRVFAPLVKKLHKKGVNVTCTQRFTEACKKDFPELIWYARDNQAEWSSMMAECLAM